MTLFISVALLILSIYFAVGLVFGILFSFAGGAEAIDSGASSCSLGFKLVIIPGCIIFWPCLLARWVRKSAPPEEFSRHRRP
jgi:hypothetical protein